MKATNKNPSCGEQEGRTPRGRSSNSGADYTLSNNYSRELNAYDDTRCPIGTVINIVLRYFDSQDIPTLLKDLEPHAVTWKDRAAIDDSQREQVHLFVWQHLDVGGAVREVVNYFVNRACFKDENLSQSVGCMVANLKPIRAQWMEVVR